MNQSSGKDQTIGFAGVAPHERNTIDYVQKVYPHRLPMVRTIADPEAANIVFADPQTPEGQRALRRDDVFLIALMDRRYPSFVEADVTLYRPLRPRAVLEALTDADSEPDTPPRPRLISESGELANIFREAMRAEPSGQSTILSSMSQNWLVIDPARDRIRGKLDQLSADNLSANDRQVFSRMPYADSINLLSDDAEAPLYKTLWNLSHQLKGQCALFSKSPDARFKFECWPNFAEAGLTGKLLRAISLMRHGSFSIEEACTRTGLDRATLLILLNGSWLTGEMCLVKEDSSAAPTSPQRPTWVNASVLSRIRNRLSGA